MVLNHCKYGHYEEGNEYLPECINEVILDDMSEDNIVPDEDDYYSFDGGITWLYHGKQIFRCDQRCEERHNVGAHLAAYAMKEHYWPNAWIISDHGNAHLVEYGQ